MVSIRRPASPLPSPTAATTTLEVDYTIYYPDVLDTVDAGEIEGVQADDLEVVIAMDRVISLGPFSLDIPQEWFNLPAEDDVPEFLDGEELLAILDVFGEDGLRAYIFGHLEGLDDAMEGMEEEGQ